MCNVISSVRQKVHVFLIKWPRGYCNNTVPWAVFCTRGQKLLIINFVSQTNILVSKMRWFTIVCHYVSALATDYCGRVSCFSCISICWVGRQMMMACKVGCKRGINHCGSWITLIWTSWDKVRHSLHTSDWHCHISISHQCPPTAKCVWFTVATIF
jgi:hypothetical protein